MSLTHDEIMNQPRAWSDALTRTPVTWGAIAAKIDATIDHALFMGSGTSLYIAQTAAHSFMEITGVTASAIPTSEAFLSAQSTVPRSGTVLAFVISRSGTTSEALLATDSLRANHPHVRTIGVTCNSGTELARRSEFCIELPAASERSVVMTQSFTTMLLALQIVATQVAGDDDLMASLATLPAVFSAQLPEVDAIASTIGGSRDDDLTITLGLGPNQGLAEEGTLKLKEMTQVACEAYNPMEFRHGPISIVNERTLVLLLEGQREAAYLPAVERDLAQYGSRVIAVGPHGGIGPDRLVIGPDLGDLARCVLYLPFLQLFAYYRAIANGLDPDRPRNLNQVVVLDAH
ncbi:MAG TPA: SIS domain-containing protein [Thermomicrobiales bacterium]|nr:SIS domain-containing protein [Thermomicrobiales bacterium]